MVYHGPAKGCQRCKDRHVKCDLTRPICNNCARLGFSCPGFTHELDVVLRDETAFLLKYKRLTRRHISDTSARRQAGVRCQASALPNEVSYGLELHAPNFLLSGNASSIIGDAQASHGHLDSLGDLFAKSAPDSPLSLATCWLSALILGFDHRRGTEATECELLARTIQSLRLAIDDDLESLKDETLIAVVLIAYGTHLRARRYALTYKCSIHQEGAEALVRKRGPLNFRAKTSIAMYDAVRHNALGGTISNSTTLRNWDLWALDHDLSLICDSYSPGTELDACGVQIVSLRDRLEHSTVHELDDLRQELCSLSRRLARWLDLVPLRWLQRPVGNRRISYPSLEVCYQFNNWYLHRIQTAHLLKELEIMHLSTGSLPMDFTCEMIWISNVVDSNHVYHAAGVSDGKPCTRDGSVYEAISPGCDPLDCKEISPDSPSRALMGQQIHDSILGSRLFGQTLDRLDLLLSRALERLMLPPEVSQRYREVILWATTRITHVQKV